MKKAAAVLASVLLYIGTFLLMFRVFMGDQIRWFLFGFPVMTAMYFVVAGNIFARCLHLNRWCLWLSMNLIGGLCSLIILLAWFPTLLTNGMILFLIGPLAGVFAVVWAVVGLGFLCMKGLKGRAALSDGIEAPDASCPKRAGVRGGTAKKVIFAGGLLLLILAASGLYVGVRGFASIRPAADYEDSGVHTFIPYDILPVQVKNNATGRAQRNNPTRTVYMVNETEAAALTGLAEEADALTAMEQTYPSAIHVVTLGSRGSLCSAEGQRYAVEAKKVQAVDTTAAGDTYIGYFLALLMEGKSVDVCMEMATRASAIAVSRMGAAPSIPLRSEAEA